MKQRRGEKLAWAGNTETLADLTTYDSCAFARCNGAPAEGLNLPLCPKHCQTVYLTVKDMLANASLNARTKAANNGGHPRVLASKVRGVIYFARLGDLIKIGYTTNLRQRMASLYRDHHLRAEVLATMPGTMGTEKALHAKFGPLWERGEMFRPGQELLDYIKSIAV